MFRLDLSVWVEVLLRVRDEDLLGVVRERWVLSSCGRVDDGAGMDGGGKKVVVEPQQEVVVLQLEVVKVLVLVEVVEWLCESWMPRSIQSCVEVQE